MPKDYYRILGVPKSATAADIKKAYRSLAMQYHPDRNQGKEKWANDKFKEINEAFAVLGDPEKRKSYDQFGSAADINRGDIFKRASTRHTFEDVMKDYGEAGLGVDFLNEIFGDAFKKGDFSYRVYTPSGAGYSQSSSFNLSDLINQARRPGADGAANYELVISAEDARKGAKKLLTRHGKKLEVVIPPQVRSGSVVKLRNALKLTDGRPGDILVKIKVKSGSATRS